LEIFVDEGRIILQKYEPTDIFNGSKDNLFEYQGKKISRDTIVELAKLAGIVE
jgi:transcriptional pleiotropic regulator of transition state genes